MENTRVIRMLAATAMAVALAACGGGSSGANGGPSTVDTPATSADPAISVVGKIDGFGSIFVNGIEFETSSTTYEVDDDDAFDDSALSVGMVVRIDGTRSGENSGRASRVYYDDEIEGPVMNLRSDGNDIKTFSIFDVRISADAGLTVFRGSGFSFASLSDGDHVEVSGEFQDGVLHASYLELEDDDDDDFEAKGTISAFNGVDEFVLTLVGGSTLEVMLAAGAELPASGIADGQFVEVEGTMPDPVVMPARLLAHKVELEDRHHLENHNDDGEDRREIEIEGLLSRDDSGTWSIRGTELAFSDATQFEAGLTAAIEDGSAHGRLVEARGRLEDRILVVDRMRIEDHDLEIKGLVAAVAPADAIKTGTLTISFPPASGMLDVLVNESTSFMNDHGLTPFDLSDLVPGVSFVEIHARLDADGQLIAGVLELEDGGADEYEVEGPLDAAGFVSGVSVTVLGVTFWIDADTLLEDGEPRGGDSVDVEDQDRDGVADEIDIED